MKQSEISFDEASIITRRKKHDPKKRKIRKKIQIQVQIQIPAI